MRRVLSAALITLWAWPAFAAPVQQVAADGTLHLADGTHARLADVVYPDSELATAWLAQHLMDKEVPLTEKKDRYGIVLARGDMQPAMLRDGAAVIFAQAQIPEDWKAAEKVARVAKRGVWSDPAFILSPKVAGRHLQQFHVVVGRVTRVYKDRQGVQLNFGANWHTDFSVSLRGPAAKQWGSIATGSMVAARGVLFEQDGPMIRIERPESLELISGPK